MAISNRAYYKANPSLKAANVNVPYTEEQVQEYMKCSQDPVYFIENYAKIISLDVGVILFKLYPYQRRLIEAIHNNNRVIGRIFRQAGKALPLDTPIATVNGLVPMVDIVEGSQVYGPDGKLCTVTAVTDPHEVNMFKITFDDGNEVICCEDHQWTVTDRHNTRIKVDGKYQPATLVMTTKDMYNSKWKKTNNRGYTEYAYYIPNTEPVQYPTKQQLIEPYLLGVWLGDGSSDDPSITTHVNHVKFLKEQGIELIPRKSSENRTAKTEKVKSLNVNDLRHYDLLKNKHIPHDYLFGDIDQRIKLLQGLMDTDGFISKDIGTSHIQLGTHNMRLLNDIYVLLCSLGLKVTKLNFPKTNSIRYSFSCPRSQFDVFRIPHKIERQPLSNPKWKYINSRTIQNIEPLNERMMGKCIQVDNESSSYLCTNSFIPTHNSQLLAAYMVWYILFNEHKTAAVLANKQDIAVEILGRVQFMIENLPPWLQQGIVEWNKKSIELENGSSCFAAATSPSAIRGKSCVTGDTKVCICEDNDEIYYTEIEEYINKSNMSNFVEDQQMYYIVYKVTNLVNGKIYVGFHKTSKIDDGYMGSGKLIKRAIEKYGIENFCKEIIQVFDNQKDAELLEATIVDKEFTLRDDTYNVAVGGNVRIMHGHNNPFYGKTHTEETLQRIKETKKRNGTLHVGYNMETFLDGDKEILGFYNVAKQLNVKNGIRTSVYRACGDPSTSIQFKDDNKQKIAEDMYKDWIERQSTYHERMSAIAKARPPQQLTEEQAREKSRKLSEKLKGRAKDPAVMEKINKNPEKIRKTAEKHRGRKRPTETCQRISDAKKGKPSSTKGLIMIANNEGQKRYIPEDDTIPDGWSRDLRTVYRPDNKRTRIPKSAVLPEGWREAKCHRS